METRMKRVPVLFIATIVSAILFWSCPSPIDPVGSTRLEDTVNPSVVIVSPVEGATYSQNVTVTGTADDNGSLATIAYTIRGVLGDLHAGTVPVGNVASDGSFSFTFDAVSFSGPISVEIQAKDWNDNVASDSVLLASPPSAISSFSASSGSKTVSLSWGDVPGASAYTIRWAADGSIPSTSFGFSATTATPGYVVPGLENGRLYTFILSASTASGTFWSSFIKCIPLSDFTLAPMVEGSYGAIKMEWSAIRGSTEFEVWRADEADGVFSNLSGLVTGYSFTDSAVTEGSTYYYKVRPALEGAPLSTWNSGSPQIIPVSGQRTTSIATAATTGKVATYTGGGSWAYVAAGTAGVYVFNVADPRSPSLAGTVATTNAKDVVVSGSRLFVADDTAGVRIFTLAAPDAPVQTGVYSGITATSISVVGTSNRAYAVNSAGGTSVVYLDVSGAGNPVLRATYSSGSYTFKDVSAIYYSTTLDFIYLAYTDSVGSVGKIAEMYSTSTTLSWYNVYTYTNYNFISVLASGNNVYALATFHADIEPPPEYSLFILNRYPSSFNLAGKTASDQSGYVADLRHDAATGKVHVVDGIGIKSYDVSAPASITLDESINTPGSPTGIALLGDYAMIGTGSRSFQSFDLRSPVALTQKPGFAPGSGRTGIAARGTRAYAVGGGVLNILSIANPESALPSLGQVAVAGAVDVAVSGTYAFIAAGSNGLKVVDVSSDSGPVVVGSALPAAGTLRAVAVKGEYVYCAGSSSMEIFDISDPANPLWKGFIDSEGMGMQDVALRGSRAYVTDGSYFQPNSLKIVDVADPSRPMLLARAATYAIIIGPVRVNDKYAFVGDSLGSGVWVVDIDQDSGTYLTEYGPADTDPSNNSNTNGIALSGGYLFATDSESGFAVLDASNPKAWDHLEPNTGFIAKTLDFGVNGGELAVEGRYAYITDSVFGLRVIRLF